jgi:hypothetical protein
LIGIGSAGPRCDYLHLCPTSDGILLGGTHESGVWSLDPDPVAKQRILSAHRKFFEGFRTC